MGTMERGPEVIFHLQRDGQSQPRRLPRELDPAYAKVDDRSLKEWLVFAGAFAENLKFYDEATNTPNGTWKPFFSQDPSEVVAKLSGYGDHEPHLALYLAFLLLLRHGQDAMNSITARHLDFYYRNVLGMEKRGALPTVSMSSSS
jgi:hypothetical protein